MKSPSATEWDMSSLSAERRAYLDEGLSFQQIAARVIDSVNVISNEIEPYRTAPQTEKDGRQIIFVVRVAPTLCDLLYNAPDGMRGRYWQSPDCGFAATKDLIDGLMRQLMNFSREQPPAPPEKCLPMNVEDIRASLEGLSAKVWPRERDHDKTLWDEDQLKVLRWEQNERDGVKGRQWRRSFRSDHLEIKGALIGRDQTEYVPIAKRDRSCKLHWYGYS